MRPTCEHRPTGAASWSVRMWTCVALAGLSAAASAQASGPWGVPRPKPVSVLTNEDPFAPGSFTLTFPDLGFETSGGITSTQYTLQVHHLDQTAHFVDYLQHVEPLTLPGGISTGDITVEIVPGSSTGTYQPLTRTFITSELYAVHFTGDLSAFGITSPVVLPSSSAGTITIDAFQGGGVTMDWDGTGTLGGLPFVYRCAVNTVYSPAADQLLALGVSSDVVQLQLPQPFEQTLMAPLYFALLHVQREKTDLAIIGLQWFEQRVDSLRGWLIDEADADELKARASEIITVLMGG